MPTRSRSSLKMARPKDTTRWKPSESEEGEIAVENEDLTLRARSSPGEKSKEDERL
jgi:hypothetical protein